MSPDSIIPSQPFTLSYYISDHTDTATYYVRARIYDATTGELLETHDLTQQATNPHLYSKRVQAPGDTSGHGRKIIVVATAYEDSGYTTKAAAYQEQAENYIVIKTISSGGGGFGIDYRVLRDIVQEEVAKIKIPEPPKIEKPVMQWDTVLGAIGALQREINRIPKDLSPVIQQIVDELKKAIEGKDVTPETDLSPVIQQIDDLRNEIALNHSEDISIADANKEALKKELPPVIEKITADALGRTKFNFNMPFSANVQGMEPKPAPESSVDINKLIV